MPTIKRILDFSSPLELRSSLRRVRKCPDPSYILFRLLWPIPWKFDLPEPILKLEDLQIHPELLDSRQAGIRQLFNIPLFRTRDTPLRSLYRLYDDLCADDLIMLGYECTYFFNHSESRWSLNQLPDPKDTDPIRYAFLASMVEALVDAFNWRQELGIARSWSKLSKGKCGREEVPPWTSNIGPLNERLCTFKGESRLDLDKSFLKRNIETSTGYLYTV
jgi:hypothetical protein